MTSTEKELQTFIADIRSCLVSANGLACDPMFIYKEYSELRAMFQAKNYFESKKISDNKQAIIKVLDTVPGIKRDKYSNKYTICNTEDGKLSHIQELVKKTKTRFKRGRNTSLPTGFLNTNQLIEVREKIKPIKYTFTNKKFTASSKPKYRPTENKVRQGHRLKHIRKRNKVFVNPLFPRDQSDVRFLNPQKPAVNSVAQNAELTLNRLQQAEKMRSSSKKSTPPAPHTPKIWGQNQPPKARPKQKYVPKFVNHDICNNPLRGSGTIIKRRNDSGISSDKMDTFSSDGSSDLEIDEKFVLEENLKNFDKDVLGPIYNYLISGSPAPEIPEFTPEINFEVQILKDFLIAIQTQNLDRQANLYQFFLNCIKNPNLCSSQLQINAFKQMRDKYLENGSQEFSISEFLQTINGVYLNSSCDANFYIDSYDLYLMTVLIEVYFWMQF